MYNPRYRYSLRSRLRKEAAIGSIIKSGVKAVGGMMKGPGVMNAVKGAGQAISGVAGKVGGQVMNTAKNVGGKVMSTVGKVGGQVANAAQNVGGKVMNTASKVGGQITSAVKNVGGQATNAVKNVGGQVANTVKNVSGQVTNAVKNVGGQVANAATNVGNKVMNTAGKVSKNVGIGLGAGVATGIAAGAAIDKYASANAMRKKAFGGRVIKSLRGAGRWIKANPDLALATGLGAGTIGLMGAAIPSARREEELKHNYMQSFIDYNKARTAQYQATPQQNQTQQPVQQPVQQPGGAMPKAASGCSGVLISVLQKRASYDYYYMPNTFGEAALAMTLDGIGKKLFKPKASKQQPTPQPAQQPAAKPAQQPPAQQPPAQQPVQQPAQQPAAKPAPNPRNMMITASSPQAPANPRNMMITASRPM